MPSGRENGLFVQSGKTVFYAFTSHYPLNYGIITSEYIDAGLTAIHRHIICRKWGTMRILICDDDALFAEQLIKCIKNFFKKQKLAVPELLYFPDGASLLADRGRKDMVFLDIEMPAMNGIHIGNELRKTNKNVLIFIVTAFSEYLDETMRFGIFRYLSKPLDKQRLFRNLKDAIHAYHSATCEVPIETKDGIFILPTSSIISVEARDRKVIVHAIRQNLHSIHNMQHWQDVLPDSSFFQTHRSYIVNFKYVTNFNHELICLDNETTAYLTRRKYSAFKEAYLLYLEAMR